MTIEENYPIKQKPSPRAVIASCWNFNNDSIATCHHLSGVTAVALTKLSSRVYIVDSARGCFNVHQNRANIVTSNVLLDCIIDG